MAKRKKTKKKSLLFRTKSFSKRHLSIFGGLAVIAGVVFVLFAFAAQDTGFHTKPGPHGELSQNVCSTKLKKGQARCLSDVRIDAKAKAAKPKGKHTGTGTPSYAVGNNGAYDPSYLQSAYNLTAASATGGTGQTVAVIVAHDNARLENDLAVYRANYGLPSCTTANGCFRKVDQRGGASYPTQDGYWGSEASLDVDMISAVCPNCHVLVVEADTDYFSDLSASVNTAVALGANVVNNSYGGNDTADAASYESFYNHPGIAIVASTGDFGYGNEFPASSPHVTAVGGTSLYQNSNSGSRDATESVWTGTGSGCSNIQPKPSWQNFGNCSLRSIGDVAAVADPGTGVWVYDAGWTITGGTSVSSPIIAAVYALNSNPSSGVQLSGAPYGNSGAFNDITSGANCDYSSVCNATFGYDQPTGLGTPNGILGFSLSAALNAPLGPPPQDATSPTAGSNLSVLVSSATSATLAWAASTDNVGVDHYDVYLGSTKAGSTTTTGFNATLKANTSYSYYVVAVDKAGNKSAKSVSFSFKTPSVSIKGSITGTVTKTSGGYVSTKVTYRQTNLASSKTVTVSTNSNGFYVLTNQNPGTYLLSVTVNGTTINKTVVVTAGGTANGDIGI